MNTEIERIDTKRAEGQETTKAPNKAEYMERINNLSAEEQAFLDGYLFAKLTSHQSA